MRWERFFDDLEDQLASEWEAERAALDTEAERLRLSQVSLRDRLHALVADDAAPASFSLVDASTHVARVTRVGADWVQLRAGPSSGGTLVVPIGSIESVGMPQAAMLPSARPAPPSSALLERMTLGFALRDLVRRRSAVTIHLVGGRTLSGTIDRAGSDHLDIALHDPGAPRRAGSVTGHRIVAFTALAWLRADSATIL